MTYVLGINSVYHESSACLLKDGKIIAAVEEERFNRKKHGKHTQIDNPHELPFASIDYCLKEAGIDFKELDQIGFSFNPIERLVKNIGQEKNVTVGDWGSEAGEQLFYKLQMSIPSILEDRYQVDLSQKINWLPHHICHGASAFYASPFKEAAIMTSDGIGEYESMMFGQGSESNIKLIKFLGEYPNSLGFLWTKASRFLNFTEDGSGEYGAGKIMALAAYGDPEKYYAAFKEFVNWEGDELLVNGKIVQFREDSHEEYERVFGFKQRDLTSELTQEHKDFAATMQKISNKIKLKMTNQLFELTKSKNLCLAGGVSLNCNDNAYILEHSNFENVYVQPGANDMGTAIGAAYYVYHQILGNKQRYPMENPYLGPRFSDNDILNALRPNKEKIIFERIFNIEKITAELLAQGKIVAWFQDRMEFGPRALGNRSLLADPRNAEIKWKLSEQIKNREWFRPLAPLILEEEADNWFIRPKGNAEADKWMLMNYKAREEKKNLIPSALHFDDTGRIQVINSKTNEKLYNLMNEFFKLTGVPIVLNTSFNIREPIVCTPQEAIATFLKSGDQGIDALVIEDFIVTRKYV